MPLYAEDPRSRQLLLPPKSDEAYTWASRMMEKGVSGEDIQFLADALNPRPEARLSPAEVLESGYLET